MKPPHDRTDAWIDGELPPDESARFEREAGLARAREWLDIDPPNLARADRLAIPQLRTQDSGLRTLRLRWLWQTAAAAAIFIGGFFIGRIGQIGPINTAPSSVTVKVTPLPTPAVRQEAVQLARADEPRRVTDEGGRLIIETTNATWVIDSSFKLASNGN